MNNLTRKKRILFCGEASFLSTGYSIYLRELFTRLYKTNKYKLAELSAYGEIDDSRRLSIPWTYYAVMPKKGDEIEQRKYRSDMENQWGAWRLEDTLLDFKPDVVIDIRDPWVSNFIFNSPFRQYFSIANMPTIDSKPQPPQFASQFCNADALLTYS